jgi:hypothetical protein
MLHGSHELLARRRIYTRPGLFFVHTVLLSFVLCDDDEKGEKKLREAGCWLLWCRNYPAGNSQEILHIQPN